MIFYFNLGKRYDSYHKIKWNVTCNIAVIMARLNPSVTNIGVYVIKKKIVYVELRK